MLIETLGDSSEMKCMKTCYKQNSSLGLYFQNFPNAGMEFTMSCKPQVPNFNTDVGTILVCKIGDLRLVENMRY